MSSMDHWRGGEAHDLVAEIEERSLLLDDPEAIDALFDAIGDARYVLLGESTHGTSEFYSLRARLTQRLILEKGFDVIAVEGDWPDCYRVNQYIQALSDGSVDARDALQAFRRWPTWMWANWEIVALVDWLKNHNQSALASRPVGFYGLDVYSLWESMAGLFDYLEGADGEVLEAMRQVTRCFAPYLMNEQAYARATTMLDISCQEEVIEVLLNLRRHKQEFNGKGEDYFNAEQNARALVGAERYYRAMMQGGPESWNLRDRHMVRTLENVVGHHGLESKAIIWAHNTHVGDARYAGMSDAGMTNIGELVRKLAGVENTFIIGFGTYEGHVIAGAQWGAEPQRMPVPAAVEGSWNEIFHRAGGENRILLSEDIEEVEEAFVPRGQRAIGVVFNPAREAWANYVPTILPRRYDGFIFFDHTEAVHPLGLPARRDEAPETYPWGM